MYTPTNLRSGCYCILQKTNLAMLLKTIPVPQLVNNLFVTLMSLIIKVILGCGSLGSKTNLDKRCKGNRKLNWLGRAKQKIVPF